MIGAEHGITPSGLVYLFGEQFVEPAKVTGETLLSSGVKVKGRELAEMMYGVALAALEADGIVRLELARRKRLLGLASAQTAAIGLLGAATPGGLEGSILGYLNADSSKNDVANVLNRQIGQDMADPWGHITEAVKRDLVAHGFVHEERTPRTGLGKLLGDKVTLSAIPERIAPLAGQVPLVKGLLANLQARQPELAVQIWKDMRAGFQSRVEKQDNDFGD